MTDTSNQVVLDIDSVTRTYGTRVAVDNVSLSVNAGEVFGFLGPNGAGKTTLIKAITGLSRPDHGKITICGYDVAKDFPRAIANVGAIIENPDMYSYMTGYENLKYFSAFYSEVGEKEIWQVLELVGMTARAKERMSRYSLGMKQRLGIAQALLHSPKLLILDEPTNGLDPAGIKEMRELLRRLAGEGMAVFISSHILAEMQNTCDRVGIINKGKLVATKSLHSDEFDGNARLSITIDDIPRALELVKLGFDQAAEVAEGRLKVTVPIQSVSAVNAALVKEGIAVTSFAAEEMSLEKLFIELTGGGTEIV